MLRLHALVAAVLLPTAQPLLLGTTVSTATLLVAQAPAQAQNAESVAKVAQAITVRIEGATQGSGVLVKRDGNRYTVLTAGHVVSGQKPREELEIITPDGQRHQLEQGSIKRLGAVDMAVLTFSSGNSYELALVGDSKSVSMGSPIYVAGFPLATAAVNQRILRFLKGDVIANATVGIANGYQLLYSNQTLSGMSGGAALNVQGQLVGIHGQGETDLKMSEQEGVAVKTGTNQAVPIAYYSQFASGAAVVGSSGQARSADDFLAQARLLLGIKGREDDVISLTTKALASSQSAEAYLYQGITKFYMKDFKGAVAQLSRATEINPRSIDSYKWRGMVLLLTGNAGRGCSDINKAIALGGADLTPVAGRYCQQAAARGNTMIKQERIEDEATQDSSAYLLRGTEKFELGDKEGALADYSRAIAIDAQNAEAYFKRCYAKWTMGDYKGVISDCSRSIAIKPELVKLTRLHGPLSSAYMEFGDTKKACRILRAASVFNSAFYQDQCK